jgi:hypothetical protein
MTATTLEDCLKQLAKACADHFTRHEFAKFWNQTTQIHHEAVANAAASLDDQRLAQARFLHEQGWLTEFIRACIEGKSDPDPALAAAVKSYVGFVTIDMSKWDALGDDNAEKQALLTKWDAFLDADKVLTLFQVGFPRVCCITGTAKRMKHALLDPTTVGGTGCLVGPDMVLTNWHVIEPLLDDNGEARKDSETEFAIFFDHHDKQAITDHAKDVAGTVRVLPHKDWFVAGSRKLDALVDHEQMLDYALIRLATPVGSAARNRLLGEPRGWIRIPPASEFEEPRADEGVICPQHPGLLGRVFDFGRTIAKYKQASTRLAYSLNTTHGTSGAPVLSKFGELVALHEADGNGAGPGDPPPKLHNRGILLSAFADAARQHLSDADARPAVVTGVWAVRTSDDARHPLVGRARFLKWIDDQVQRVPGSKPVYVARGGEDTGKSFSIDILRTRLQAIADTVVLAFAPTGKVDGAQPMKGRPDTLLLPERPDALLAEVAKALGLDPSTIPPPPPEPQTIATDLAAGTVEDLKPNDWASKSLTKWLSTAMQSAPDRLRLLWVVLEIPPNTPFGPAMQSFLKSWTQPVPDNHPFTKFRWLFIDYEPTFIEPERKDVDDLAPTRQITADDAKAFIVNAYLAAGRGDPPDTLVKETLDFFPAILDLPEKYFWQFLASGLKSKRDRYFSSGTQSP